MGGGSSTSGGSSSSSGGSSSGSINGTSGTTSSHGTGTTSNTTTTANSRFYYNYTGGNQFISSYTSGRKIIFNATFAGAAFDGAGNFIVNSNLGTLTVQNARDKVIDLSTAGGSTFVAASEANGMIALAFNTGNVVAVQSSELLSSAFVLADGSAYRFNHVTKTWQGA